MSILNLLLSSVYPLIRKLFTYLQFCMREKQNQKVKKEESKGRTVCHCKRIVLYLQYAV